MKIDESPKEDEKLEILMGSPFKSGKMLDLIMTGRKLGRSMMMMDPSDYVEISKWHKTLSDEIDATRFAKAWLDEYLAEFTKNKKKKPEWKEKTHERYARLGNRKSTRIPPFAAQILAASDNLGELKVKERNENRSNDRMKTKYLNKEPNRGTW